MKMSDVFPSKFLGADDFSAKGEMFQIQKVDVVTMKESSSGEEKIKPIVYLVGFTKPLVVNKTNWKRIASQFGDESDDWKGKKIGVRLEQVDAFGETKDGIRVYFEDKAKK